MKLEEVLYHIIIIEIYTLLTIIAFHKLFILGFDKYVIGDHGDPWQFIWNFWWVKSAVIEGRNIFYTDYLFYPIGTHLYFHTFNFTAIFLIFPLMLLINNLIIIYNISVILAFVLSGYFMYLFLFYFLKYSFLNIDELKIRLTAFFGGCMYAFSPYIVSKALGYFNLLSVQWFPLGMLFLFLFLRNKKFPYLIGVSVSILLLFFTDFHHLYYFLISSIVFTLPHLKNLKISNTIKLIASVLLPLILISLIYFPAFSLYKESKNQYVRPYWQTITFFNFFLPPYFVPFSKLFPSSLLSLYSLSPVYMLVDSTVYLGISFIIIFTFLLAYLIILKKEKLEKDFWSLLFLFIFSIFLSLGKTNLLSLWLNDFLRKSLPFFDLLASPARHSFMGMFSFMVLFSYIILKAAIKREGKMFFGIYSILFVLFFLEFYPIFYSHYYTLKIPRSLYNISLDETNYTILNIPFDTNTQGMYLQTIHNKKILDGSPSRIDYNSTFILGLMKTLLQNEEKENIEKNLKLANVKYIIFNKNYRLDSYSLLFLNLLNTSLIPEEKTSSFEVYKFETY